MSGMMRIIQAALLVIFGFALSACPAWNGQKSKSGAVVRVVKGDPDVFVKGTLQNGSRALPANFSDTERWEFDIGGFVEELAENNYNQKVKEQTPGSQQESASTEVLTTSKTQDVWILSGNFKGTPVQLVFQRSAEGWMLKAFRFLKVTSKAGATEVQLIHTSVRTDGNAFSLLLQNKTPKQRFVYELIFNKYQPLVTKNIGDRAYEFLFGKGVRVGWKKQNPPVLQICGTLPDPIPRLIHEEASLWVKALGERMSLTVVQKDACPPFSDLNSQTISFLREWIEIQGDAAVAAFTVPIAGPGRAEIMDADIFYLLGEYEESLRMRKVQLDVLNPQILAKIEPQVRHTILHEMGHFLGLHHQFNPSVTSIMSYDEHLGARLYDYDVKAVQHLYDP